MALNDTLALPVQYLGYYVSEDKEMHAILSKTPSLPYGIEQQIQLPAEFPASLDSPLVWRGDDMAGQQDDWIVHLSSLDINAIESALLSIKAQGVPPTSLSPELFPLPASLVKSMSDISAQCYEGRGFCVLRGLDPSKYSTEDNSLIFMGLASHVGSMRAFQDRKRQQVLCHVVNAAVKLKEEQVTQPGFTDREMSFHNDEGEILALYVKNTSHEGGRTRIASAWHVYNLLATHRPDIVNLLSQEWTQDTFQDYSKFPPKVAPFLHVADGRVFFNFSRYPFTGFGKHLKRNESLPPVTLAQSEALDVVQLLASNFSMPLPSCRGDILFMNNMALLHGREPFNEHGEELQRHLIKLELRDPKRSWTLPDTLTELWDKLYGTNTEDGRREEHCCLSYELGQEREWSKNG